MFSATERLDRVFLTLLSFGLLAIFPPVCPAATIIVNETFEGYSVFGTQKPANDNVNLGVPLVSEGADSNLWLAARFGPGGDPNGNGSINADVGVQEVGSIIVTNPPQNTSHVGRVSDDTALVLRLDLTGYASATLDFDWRTYRAEGADRFVVAYYVGDGTAFQPGGLGTPNNRYDWYNDPQLGNGGTAWYTNNWVELLRDGPDDLFAHESFALPAGDIVYLAFWHDDDLTNGDFAKFDNVVVSALVPEPCCLGLCGLGLAFAAFTGLRRRG